MEWPAAADAKMAKAAANASRTTVLAGSGSSKDSALKIWILYPV
jgi:hypothetical protein